MVKSKKNILHLKKRIDDELQNFKRIEIIKPTFTLTSKSLGGSKPLLSIVDGAIRYEGADVILEHIYLTVSAHDRVLIRGRNGAGKTSLVKAVMDDPSIIRSGEWHMPKQGRMGYLDQHYGTLDPQLSVLENLRRVVPDISEVEVRKVLSTFLFKTNGEVSTRVRDLSGGEKARLLLAQIAVKTPPLLILDEVTNNIDLQTKRHVTEVLKAYPGALLIISHDEPFLEQLALNKTYTL